MTRNNSRSTLTRYALLDPRPADEARAHPLAGAVNIPLDELYARTHELPPRDATILLTGPEQLCEEAARWLLHNERHAEIAPPIPDPHPTIPCPGRLWQPNAWLAEIEPQLTPGRAADLACGTGRDTVHLASCGWDVLAVDVLPDALQRGQALASRYSGLLRPIRWRQMDLEREPLATLGQFDLVIVFRYLHRELLTTLHEYVHPGGSILCETFTELHQQRHGRPTSPGHVLAMGELRSLLSNCEIRQYSEAWRGTAHTARVWARRM
ncbi:MAG: methyltransferase domain-containing protein [Phycisphaerae bacterium]|nr:methyltransferase domain-containing protein [Phycisphaerae bacterium]